MDVEKQVREFIVEHFLLGDGSDVGSTQSLLDTGVIDSTGVLELVHFLEKTFGIEVEDRDLVPDNLDSLSRIAAFVARKMSPPAAGKAALV